MGAGGHRHVHLCCSRGSRIDHETVQLSATCCPEAGSSICRCRRSARQMESADGAGNRIGRLPGDAYDPRSTRALSRSPTTTLDACLSAVRSPLSKLSSLSAPSGFAIGHLSRLNKASALDTATALLSLSSRAGGAKPALLARSGHAVSIGTLSVPPSWETATIPDQLTREQLGGDYLVIDPSDLIW